MPDDALVTFVTPQWTYQHDNSLDTWRCGHSSVTFDAAIAVTSGVASGVPNGFYVGLSTGPETNAAYDIDYAWLIAGTIARPAPLGGGANITFNSDDTFVVRRTGSTGSWTIEWVYFAHGAGGGTVSHSVSGRPDESLYVVCGGYDKTGVGGPVTAA